jgi:hypothetical protein
MTRPSLRIPLAATGIAALLAAPSLAGAVTIPNIPGLPPGFKAPKTTVYPATIDVAGFVKVRVTENYARECTPGRDTLAEFEADFELGAPRPVTVVIQNGAVSSTGVLSQKRAGAGAVHRASFVVNRETNNCPPSQPVELSEPPICTPSLRGRLLASLSPTRAEVRDGELTPLVRRVNLLLARKAGGNQRIDCMGEIPSLSAKVNEDESDISVMQLKGIPLNVPIATDAQFLRLKKGKTLRRSVRLNGACNEFLLSNAVQNQSGYTCTITGRIVMNVKRTR